MNSVPTETSDNKSSTVPEYKDTVNLPQTEFSMRANAIEKEPEIQKFWQEQGIYDNLTNHNQGENFILHDGPPYANGVLHMGHALNKILKDIINRYQLMRGRKARYVLGWDCHGLPIELKVIQNIKAEERKTLTPLQLRHRARDFALETIAAQTTGFKRWGIWGDYENAYYTLKPAYEAAQISVFAKMVLNGYIYRGLKPVYWSPSSQTALAEAELEYPENHTSRSIYVAFSVKKPSDALQAVLNANQELTKAPLSALIWTTTPWTIPANLAISANPHLSYSIVTSSGEHGDQNYIVATELVAKLAVTFEQTLTVLASFSGEILEHTIATHPIFDRDSPILLGDHVTAESGTGLVHTAPGHGQDDFAIGNKYGLSILSPVDDYGIFTAEAGQFAGLNVLKEGNTAVIEALTEKGVLIKEEAYAHKYPYDWRTKKPVIVRATEQWFASVEGFREAALEAIEGVKWIPAMGKNRITSMVQERSDWCISRQRSWGVPIPAFYHIETGEVLLTPETIAHIQTIIAERGSDAWWELSVEELLPSEYRDRAANYRKGTDTMDVWFDSGSSWAAVLGGGLVPYELGYPADLYLEGSDQHRGWFQSSLLTSVATNGKAPYKTVLTHGFTVDENGRKMSKSEGNGIDPMVVINGGKNLKQEPAYGADVLRLWVASVDYSGDVPVGKTILNQMGDVSRKIRNTARFLLSNLNDFDPAKDAVPFDQLTEADRYILHRLSEVVHEITAAFDSFQFFRFFQTIQNFCTVDLSNFYLDIAKDRLYISAPSSPRRRSCQTVLALCLETIAKAIAPVLCHTAEDIWQHMPYAVSHKSVFQAGWIQTEAQWNNPQLAAKWQSLRDIRTEVNKVMEQARNAKAIGSSLEAKVLLEVTDTLMRSNLLSLGKELRYLFIASQVELVNTLPEQAVYTNDAEGVRIAVVNADGEKCPRCWNYSTRIGESTEHPHLCERCVDALAGNF
ncbi:isoleucine--tRNA ligase [Tumidithrix helvetica PCC 7403]|uniref:isoleucine--tRNA ligase n=1 Tax=Tumidithrix helvetica TaxID=3457545 RepID=UPI003CACCC21